MVSFENDYNKGAHPAVIDALVKTNLDACTGYGEDEYCARAKEKIKAALDCPDAEIFFLTGGTQTNAVVISSLTREYEGVVAATTGHVSVHEAGAIEGTGHKVLEIPAVDGKITPDALRTYLETFYADGNYTHMVFPGIVYISYPTETGSLYSKKELTALHEICGEYKIPLYLDGARLGYGLASPECDLTLPEIAKLTDVFYIGGTKVGTLVGEAVVFTKKNMPEHFLTHVKHHGALLAKGRALGVQFDALFTDGLYFEIGKHAMKMAAMLEKILSDAGLETYIKSPTNQKYVVIDNERMKRLGEKVAFSFWENIDAEHTAIRFVTSWGTTDEELEYLREVLRTV